MKTLRLFSASLVILGVAAAAFAQGGMGRGGGNYNPATETTLSGTVVEATNPTSQGSGGGGIHLLVSTAAGPMSVHVGPAWFVSSKNVTFAKGEAVTVVGSKVTMSDQEVVIAREIKKGDDVLTLRDAKGYPLWSGRGRTE